MQYETVGEYNYAIYTQTVSRKATGSSDSAKTLDLNASCRIAQYTDAQLGISVADSGIVTGDVKVNGTFDVNLYMYPNVSYIAPYETLPSAVSSPTQNGIGM